jgi:RNA binding exosome subunit
MEFYTLDLDTGIIKVDINDIMKKVRDDMDDYEDELEVTIEPVYEDGKLYAKITGNMMIGEGLKPTRAGDIIAYFYMSICYNINYNIKWTELESVKKVPGMKLDYWNKTQLAAALQIRGMDSKGNEAKEGRFVWSQSNGDKVIQLDNYGTECTVYIQVKNSKKDINSKVVEELNNWVTKKKPSNAESAEIKLFGDTPWVVLKFKIGGKKGSDLFEDIREDVINDWGDDFVEKAQDIVDDLK